ncbi:3-oxoacyl-[acyl-carrier-protein] reductase FabG [Buchnera aphidicola (Eriosoma grossulariae)]
MKLKNNIALVTGANRGIGKVIAEKLKKKVKMVIGTATTQSEVEKINKFLKNHGIGTILNFENSLSIDNTINMIYKNFGSIDILINNAGINYDKLLMNINLFEWNKIIKINLTSVFHISKNVIKNMIRKKQGRIITIGSIIGQIGNIGQTSYAATKSGIIGFHKSLALEVARYGITVNIIAPGFIKTNMTNNLNNIQKKKYLSKIPMNRFGHANDIANAVIFLASNKSAYITGHILHVNGGMYMN